ncbi:MAG: sigma 54-interacting transcriptional regulator [Gemmatimonadota bacterium]|nr:MAG: sigma 54-interacting transcriptional regulator [Gemmatimonadota bacterium]
MNMSWHNRIDLRGSIICATLAVVVFLLFFGLSYTSFFIGFEKRTYDIFLRLRGGYDPHPDIILVFIGDDTIEKIGAWPISRDFYATFLHILSEYDVRAVGFDLLFSERSTEHPEYDEQLVNLTRSSGNVSYPYFFYLEEEQFIPEEFWVSSDVARIGEPVPEKETKYNRALGGIFPFQDLILAASGTGHGNILADEDGVVRKSPLVIEYNGELYPSLALSMAGDLLGVEKSDVRIQGKWMMMTGSDGIFVRIPVTSKGEMFVNYAGGPGRYTNYSFIQILQSYRQILEGEEPLLSLEKLRDKIVFVGMTATGAANVRPTPCADHQPLLEIQANILDNILQGNFVTKAGVGSVLFSILLCALVIGFLFPNVGTVRGTIISILLLIATGVYAYLSLAMGNVWMRVNQTWGGVVFSTLFIHIYLFRRQEKERLAAERRALELSEDLLTRERHLNKIRGEIENRQKDLEAMGDEEISDRVAIIMEERELLVKEREKLEEQTRDLKGKLSHVTGRLKRAEAYQFAKAGTGPQREELRGEYSHIVGDSSKVLEILKVVDRVAESDASVLITGESGTGKELVARAIHYNSRRKDGPLVIINAAAIPRELVESELFGHERGAFTGATAKKVGKFELANGGTIFLDEIGDMPPGTQAKLLRVIESKEFMRVGGAETIRVDVRIVTATNKDLQAEMEAGRFREDLFHRLNLIPIHMPPLRERKEDIPVLVKHALHRRAGEEPLRISDEAMGLLMSYTWPGNVRELEQCIERALLLRESLMIQAEDLPPNIKETVSVSEKVSEEITLTGAMERFEREFIIEALKRHNWNKSKTAEALQLGRRNLHKKIKKYGINESERL